MGLDYQYFEGQTPLDEDEKDGLLIRSISTRQELDEFEQLNIQQAVEWTLRNKFKPERILTEDFIKELHYKMLGDVWKWAGEFRRTNKNLGVDKFSISICLKQLLDDAIYWTNHKVFDDEEIAIRFKHRIVSIHCFSNGNGRHSRLIADIVINHIFGKNVFTWSKANLTRKTEARKSYLNALRDADEGDIKPLIIFSRS